MGIRSALYADLIADEELATLLGATAEEPKVFPHVAFVGTTFDYVCFRRSDAPGERSLREGSLRVATITVTGWSSDTARVEAIGERLRTRLEQFAGDKPDHDVHVSLTKPIGEEDDDVPADDGSAGRFYSTTVTVRITYKALS